MFIVNMFEGLRHENAVHLRSLVNLKSIFRSRSLESYKNYGVKWFRVTPQKLLNKYLK